jgi:hypothetical protein
MSFSFTIVRRCTDSKVFSKYLHTLMPNSEARDVKTQGGVLMADISLSWILRVKGTHSHSNLTATCFSYPCFAYSVRHEGMYIYICTVRPVHFPTARPNFA